MLSLKLLTMLIEWSNDKIDLSVLDSVISQVGTSLTNLLSYIKGAFFILPFSVTMSCLGVVVAVLLVRLVLAVVNVIWP